VSRRLRLALLTSALAGLAALLVWGVVGLPAFGDYRGPYGKILNRIAVPERHTTNVVGATVFDYRGFDTLGEEFILFAAVVGVTLLLRGQVEEGDVAEASVGSDAIRIVGLLAVGPAVVVALWLAAFGYVTPGGGFQGGVALASGLVLVFLAWSYRSWHGMTREKWVDPLEAVGAGGYVVVGVAALISGLPFLANLLGPGTTGTLRSGGSIAFLNWASAIEVAAANVLLYSEFLKAYVLPRARGSP
jgi:multicomponent Na+:H+ antiporter subunit B